MHAGNSDESCSVHEVVSRPLGEERDGDHDAQPPSVSGGLDEAHPSYIRCHLAVELDSGADLLKFVLNEGVGSEVDVSIAHRSKGEGPFTCCRQRGNKRGL